MHERLVSRRIDALHQCFLVLTLCYFVLVFLCPFSISITSLGEERANLSAFPTFVRFVVLSISSSSWCLGRAAICDCGIPWTFLLPFFIFYIKCKNYYKHVNKKKKKKKKNTNQTSVLLEMVPCKELR